MKRLLHGAFAVAALLALAMTPAEVANAYWGPGYGAWRHGDVHDPTYRYAPPVVKRYIRDLYLLGPEYAAWREQRRHGW